MSSPDTLNKRRTKDIMKLMMSNYSVKMEGDSSADFHVMFKGPADSAYSAGTWRVRVSLPPQYPYKSPSIGFLNKMYHPNVDLASGSVCLDVINQTWSPMFDLLNIFDIFLPQLLLYPNPADPLNGEAGALYRNNKAAYDEKVQHHVEKFAMDTSLISTPEKTPDVKSFESTSSGLLSTPISNLQQPDALTEPSAMDLDDEVFSDMDDDMFEMDT